MKEGHLEDVFAHSHHCHLLIVRKFLILLDISLCEVSRVNIHLLKLSYHDLFFFRKVNRMKLNVVCFISWYWFFSFRMNKTERVIFTLHHALIIDVVNGTFNVGVLDALWVLKQIISWSLWRKYMVSAIELDVTSICHILSWALWLSRIKLKVFLLIFL